MHRRILAGALLVLALAGCSNAELPTGTGSTVLPPTASSVAPTTAPTAVPLADLDLEELAIQSGDLPAGYSGGQISDEPPSMFDDGPAPVKFFDQHFQKSDEIAGGVRIMLYDDTADLNMVYDDLSKVYDLAGDGMDDANKVAEIGDATRVAGRVSESLELAEGIYKRCQALVFVRFIGTHDTSDVEAYLKRLDKRLQPLVCQP